MSKKSIIFSTVVIFILGIISSIFLYSLINIIGDLFRDLGGPLPTLSGFIVNTSPLVPFLVFLLYTVFAGVIFFFGGKVSEKNLKMYRIVVFVVGVALTLLTVIIAFILQNNLYQIS